MATKKKTTSAKATSPKQSKAAPKKTQKAAPAKAAASSSAAKRTASDKKGEANKKKSDVKKEASGLDTEPERTTAPAKGQKAKAPPSAVGAQSGTIAGPGSPAVLDKDRTSGAGGEASGEETSQSEDQANKQKFRVNPPRNPFTQGQRPPGLDRR